MLTKQKLIDFENDIKNEFLAGHIRYPIHLSSGNESQLISIFKENNIGLNDWVFASHRNHYSALLKGIPKEWLKEQILKGNSMHIMSKEYKFFSSSIVGGSLPIAVGTAWAIKEQNRMERVYAFLGDMAGESGIAHECIKYASNFVLPITFIIEDNNMSTNSLTDKCWNGKTNWQESINTYDELYPNVIYYRYTRLCPHINTLEHVEFK